MNPLFKKYLHSVLDPDEFPGLKDYLKSQKNAKEITSLMLAIICSGIIYMRTKQNLLSQQWRSNTTSFNTSMDRAVRLERKYNVKIHFENEALRKLRFTASLENGTVEQVIHAIGIAAQITRLRTGISGLKSNRNITAYPIN